MHWYTVSAVGLAMFSVALVAQTPPVTGDRSSPLRPLTGAGNVGVSNAVLRDQPEVRALRVVVEAGAVISMGVYIGQSTRIYNRETGEITYGRVPAGAVVVSGNLPSDDGRYSLYCAVIVKQVDEKTRAKVGINELLRSA